MCQLQETWKEFARIVGGRHETEPMRWWEPWYPFAKWPQPGQVVVRVDSRRLRLGVTKKFFNQEEPSVDTWMVLDEVHPSSEFAIAPANRMSRTLRRFGFGEPLGDPAFDNQFTVRHLTPETRTALSESRVQEALRSGLTAGRIKATNGQLRFEQGGGVTDAERLVALFHLLTTLADALDEAAGSSTDN